MFGERLDKIKQVLLKEKLGAVLVSSVSNITYLTGFSAFSEREREAYLIIGKDFEYIITDSRYAEAIKIEVPHFTLFERTHDKKLPDLLKELKNKVGILGFEEDNLTVSEYRLIKKYFKLKPFQTNHIRFIKSGADIKKIEKSCQIADLAFQYILEKIKTGVTEKQIAWGLEKFIKEKGVQFSFPPIVAFGKNSAVPHHQTGSAMLGPESSSGQAGQIVLLDFGVKFEDYCSDMTRTIFFGKPSGKQKDIYKVVLAAQLKAVDFIKTSLKSDKQIKASQVDKVARDYIISQGYPSIPHSLGHGIGLEVHEHPSLSPKSKEILKEGMVFSIEPGIYLPGLGGVRIEDLFVIEINKLRQLTTFPKNLIKV